MALEPSSSPASSSSPSSSALPSVPFTVQPPSPDEVNMAVQAGLIPADHSGPSTISSTDFPIPRRPMHRSISIPLSERMGSLRHPRPRPVGQTSDTSLPQHGRISSSSQSILQSPQRHHPLRNSIADSTDSPPATDIPSSDLAHLILDTLQLPISHLLHIIPPHLLDANHETLSATSVSVPVTSVEALMEAFRSINWICDAFIERDLASRASSSEVAETSRNVAVQPPASEDTTGADQPSSSEASGACEMAEHQLSESRRTSSSEDQSSSGTRSSSSPSRKSRSFDVSELAQRAADVVSGQAADKAIDLVLSLQGLTSEGEVLTAMPATASGDEGAVKSTLIHVLSRILTIAPIHSTLKISLKVSGDVSDRHIRDRSGMPCLFEMQLSVGSRDELASLTVLEDCVDASVLQIAQAQCQWTRSVTELTATADITFQDLETSDQDLSASNTTHTSDFHDRQRFLPRLALGEEPTAQQLSDFVQNELKGKTIALHASEGSLFAQNLTLLLQNCDCEVSLASVAPTGSTVSTKASDTDQNALPAARTAIAMTDGRPAFVRYSTGLALAGGRANGGSGEGLQKPSGTAFLDPVTGVPLTLSLQSDDTNDEAQRAADPQSVGMQRDSSTETIKTGGPPTKLEAYSFVMVDDDIDTLQQELLRLRSALPILRCALGQNTPTAQYLNRSARDGFPLSKQVVEGAVSKATPLDLTHAIVYFTSLKNFRSIRDVVQPILESAIQAVGEGSAYTLPEIVVVPKPAGARRILTALKTAMHKPIVDPFFAPLATSPMSPYLWEAQVGRRESANQLSLVPLTELAGQSNEKLSASPHRPIKRPIKSKDRPLRLSPLPPPDPTAILGQEKADQIVVPSHQTVKPVSPGSANAQVESAKTTTLPLPTPSVRSSQGSSSPLPAETLEYFSETAARMGSKAATGLVIQSPDGRPAALYFDPNLSGSVSGRSSQARRVGSASGPASVRSNASWGSDAANLLANSRRSSDERQKHQHPSVHDVLTGKGSGNDDKVGSSVAELRRSSNESASSFTARPTNWGDAPAGTLFSPQVGIDDVLSAGRLPVATPISSQPPLGEAHSPTSHPMPLNQDSTPSAAENQDASIAAIQDGGGETLPPSGHVGVSSTTANARPAEGDRSTPVTNIREAPPRPPRADTLGGGEAAIEADGHLRGIHPSFATVSPATKPSAQPQSGLLIGAGFAASSRRGGVPKKAQVREKVLPPIKVLIVEDNPINQRILKQFMTKKKIKFETAVNGREAVDKWATGGFHLILMDIQLPVMDGIEATKEIRKQELSANVGQLPATPPIHTAGLASAHQTGLIDMPAPASAGLGAPSQLTSSSSSSAAQTPFRASVIIVALTASVLNSDRVAALAAGCNDFLNKPVSLPWLEKKIIEWGSMQYILLSGAGVFDAERRAQRSLHRGQGAAAAAATSSDVRRGFGSNPDIQAKLLASKLHLPIRKRPLGSVTGNAPRMPAKYEEAPVKSDPVANELPGEKFGNGAESERVSGPAKEAVFSGDNVEATGEATRKVAEERQKESKDEEQVAGGSQSQ